MLKQLPCLEYYEISPDVEVQIFERTLRQLFVSHYVSLMAEQSALPKQRLVYLFPFQFGFPCMPSTTLRPMYLRQCIPRSLPDLLAHEKPNCSRLISGPWTSQPTICAIATTECTLGLTALVRSRGTKNAVGAIE